MTSWKNRLLIDFMSTFSRRGRLQKTSLHDIMLPVPFAGQVVIWIRKWSQIYWEYGCTKPGYLTAACQAHSVLSAQPASLNSFYSVGESRRSRIEVRNQLCVYWRCAGMPSWNNSLDWLALERKCGAIVQNILSKICACTAKAKFWKKRSNNRRLFARWCRTSWNTAAGEEWR